MWNSSCTGNHSELARTKEEIAATAALISDAGGRAVALQLDVRDAAAVRAAVSETTNTLGNVTLLVNNAGTPGPAGLDWEVNSEAWFECIEVVVREAFLLAQAVAERVNDYDTARVEV